MKDVMKIFVLLMLVGISCSLQAQSAMTADQKQEVKSKYEEYRKSLSLTEDQEKKTEAINLEFIDGLAQLKASPERKIAKYRKFKSLQEKKDSQMKDVLDAEQYKKYRTFQAEMKEDFRENRKRN
jgi:uncharacterized protein YfaQ (DUF2300 family)